MALGDDFVFLEELLGDPAEEFFGFEKADAILAADRCRALPELARQKRRDLVVILMTEFPDLRLYVDGYKLPLKPLEGNQRLCHGNSTEVRCFSKTDYG